MLNDWLRLSTTLIFLITMGNVIGTVVSIFEAHCAYLREEVNTLISIIQN